MFLIHVCDVQCRTVDTWLRLHARLLAVVLSLHRSAKNSKNKFNSSYKSYKEDKLANEILESDNFENFTVTYNKVLRLFNQWWHQTKTVMKHVMASTNDSNSMIQV